MKIKITKDGSHTLYNEELDETYHSTHGAIQEANHVFIKHGIETFKKAEISVLEVGFGTGLNAILTYNYAIKNSKKIIYFGLESFSLPKEIINELNYKTEISNFDFDIFSAMHKSTWGLEKEIDSSFSLTKIHNTLQEFKTENKFDVIYYDAFGPRAQKEMWEKPLFEKLYSYLKPNGKLVTYCAMGQFKRDLKACGFIVTCFPGPPGKREMTVGLKID